MNSDAVGDMNVLTTFDANWCVEMSRYQLILNVTGAGAHLCQGPRQYRSGALHLQRAGCRLHVVLRRAIYEHWWRQPGQDLAPRAPSSRSIPSESPLRDQRSSGSTSHPDTDENEVGENHTVTATISDLLANPQPPGILVTFTVISGPNAGASGTCSVNADCTTDANSRGVLDLYGFGR